MLLGLRPKKGRTFESQIVHRNDVWNSYEKKHNYFPFRLPRVLGGVTDCMSVTWHSAIETVNGFHSCMVYNHREP